jgi:hypothetical protein
MSFIANPSTNHPSLPSQATTRDVAIRTHLLARFCIRPIASVVTQEPGHSSASQRTHPLCQFPTHAPQQNASVIRLPLGPEDQPSEWHLPNDSAVPPEARSAPNQRSFLDNQCHAKQIDGVHRGAAKCWLRTYPLNLPGSCQRRECSMSKTTVLLCRSREPTVTVRWVS